MLAAARKPTPRPGNGARRPFPVRPRSWVTLSEANYERMLELWDTPGREHEPPYFGWLSTELPTYPPSTLNLKTMVHTPGWRAPDR